MSAATSHDGESAWDQLAVFPQASWWPLREQDAGPA